MGKFLLSPLVATLFAVACPLSLQARQVIYPPDGSLLTEDSVEVLGYRLKSAGNGKLSAVASGPGQEKEVKPGLFSIAVKLTSGVNTITLDGDMVRVFYTGDEKAPKEAKSYRKPDPHAVDNGCEDCHLFKGDQVSLTEDPPGLCSGCHDDVTLGGGGEKHLVAHPPADDGECLECHRFHGTSIKAMAASELAEICFGCHDSFTEGEGLTVHSPVEDGGCLECHLPHGSAHEKILKAPKGELCFDCHDNPGVDGSGAEWASPHPALDDGCGTCHDPHVSKEAKLLVDKLPALCEECHDAKNADGDGNPWKTPHPPVDEGDCTGCHLPHGSAESSLLPSAVPALCEECHDNMNADEGGNPWKTPHPPVDEGDCLACHQPHGAAEGSLLAAPTAEVCSGCHDDMKVNDEGKPWKTPHPPVDEGDCAGCHRPHGSTASSLLVKRIPDLCSECHDDKRKGDNGEVWPFPHSPSAKGACLACHRPHGTDRSTLLSKAMNDLCTGCHPTIHERHITPVEESSVVPPDDFPMTSRGEFVCTGCHRPHGSTFEKLVKGSMAEFCTICHPY